MKRWAWLLLMAWLLIPCMALSEEAAIIYITEWEPLEGGISQQTLTASSDEQPRLPAALKGRTHTGETAVMSVKWPSFTAENKPGVYWLTPQMPYGYEAMDETLVPRIQVTLIEAIVPAGTLEADGMIWRLEKGEVILEKCLEGRGIIIGSELVFPDGESYPVRRVAAGAFKNGDVHEVEMRSGLIVLGRGAFENCQSLAQVSLPSTLAVMGESVFAGCTGLEKVALAQGLQVLGAGVFRNCTALKEVLLPDSVSSMGPGAFENCTGLRRVFLSQGMNTIPKGAFAGCSGLVSVDIPAGIRSIGALAFKNCTNLEEVRIYGALSSVSPDAFEGCSESMVFRIFDEAAASLLLNSGIAVEQIQLEQ